jgi:hypothetical protein
VLTEAEQRRTSDELNSNLGLAGADPVDVRQLRDYLEQAVCDARRAPVSFPVLTEDARARAHQWFSLREPLRHGAATS